MVFKIFCILVLWMKISPALEGLRRYAIKGVTFPLYRQFRSHQLGANKRRSWSQSYYAAKISGTTSSTATSTAAPTKDAPTSDNSSRGNLSPPQQYHWPCLWGGWYMLALYLFHLPIILRLNFPSSMIRSDCLSFDLGRSRRNKVINLRTSVW